MNAATRGKNKPGCFNRSTEQSVLELGSRRGGSNAVNNNLHVNGFRRGVCEGQIGVNMNSVRQKLATVIAVATLVLSCAFGASKIGREVAVPVHLQDGEEFQMPLAQLVVFGKTLFTAMWTSQEGAGSPLTKGTGNPLSDPTSPLVFPRNFNRISGPDTNSCSGCHNKPDIGGGGDIVGNVFVLGQRFDFATFDSLDPIPTGGGVDESGNPVFLQTIADSRKTIGMFGSGYLEMIARQMTADLRTIRDATPPGGSRPLVSKGVSFGMITHHTDGTWDTSKVVGLPAPALVARHNSDRPHWCREHHPNPHQECRRRDRSRRVRQD